MSDKLEYCNYHVGEISFENMHWGLAVPLQNGTRVLMRDRYQPDVWLSGIYEFRRWPNDSGSFHAGVHVDGLPPTDIQWRLILDDDEVRLL